MGQEGSLIGETLSHYRVLESLGAGGMGEVYRAEDTVLGRHVALKVLPEAFTADPQRLARFEREAKVLATLDHPNIAAVYSFEEDRDIHFLVMQLAEGETLAERIARSPIPLDEALPIASQIAQGLESAHEHGIIHRDLKPGNVKVDPAGHVRVLDFGLAKALHPTGGGLEGDLALSREGPSPAPKPLSESPTLTAEMTAPGVLLGTAAYMSPEQARGKPVDRRVDIWAFGCVLFEMLSGQQPFPGETVTDYLAKILEREPDWEVLPRETPAPVWKLLRRCLAKDPQRRLHDMGDVWLEIEEIPQQAVLEQLAVPPVPRWRRLAPWMLAALGVVFGLWAFLKPEDSQAPASTQRFSLATQPLAVGPHPVSPIVALSREGSLLAYVSGEGDTGKIILRRLDSFEERAVVDTDGAQAPFFSPDGRWLGFAAEGKLKKIPVEGGKVTALCDVEVMHGATWSRDDTIVFSGAEGLLRISADGGDPVQVTTEEIERGGEVGHHNPDLLPGGDAVIFVTVRSGGDPIEIALVDFETGERKSLIEGGGNARFLPTGHLAYAADGKLFVAGFDHEQQELLGTPVAVIPDVMMNFPLERSLGHFTISDNGTLAYLSGLPVTGGVRWVWVDRAGNPQRTGEFQRRMFGPKFSPDGTRLAVATERWGQDGMHVWIEDLTRGTFSRLTFEGENWWPLWSPDGQKIAFPTGEADGSVNVFWRFVDGSGDKKRLTHGDFSKQPATWSRDGKGLIFHQSPHPETGWDVLALDLDGGTEPRPLLTSRFDERQPDLSPDGNWLAYVSNETGRLEVYVRCYPDLSGKWQISNEGGAEPAWSSQGDELFYRNGQKLMVVEMTGAEVLTPGRPQMLFEGEFVEDSQFGRGFDVAPDDQGFVFVEQSSVEEIAYELRTVLNWFSEIESLVSAEPGT